MIKSKNIFVSICPLIRNAELDQIAENFNGDKYFDKSSFYGADIDNKILYIAGDIEEALGHSGIEYAQLRIIRNLSNRLVIVSGGEYIHSSAVPLNIAGAGVLLRNFFSANYFADVFAAHKFQNLTESNKGNSAYRKGIYISNVENDTFNLLRCSTNLDGPTLGFKEVDRTIIAAANRAVSENFTGAAELNHVLAQIYYNKVLPGNKQRKGAISEHSDKTKDMPDNGIIAFCSFYDELDKVKKKNKCGTADSCDWQNSNGVSVFTKMFFRNKLDESKNFEITLYPNSLFAIPLSTNREYTHRIVPSGHDISDIPVRMGYVIRCSNVLARYTESGTYILGSGAKLVEGTEEEKSAVKQKYREENFSTEKVIYEATPFSFNEGDYMRPVEENPQEKWSNQVPDIQNLDPRSPCSSA